MLGFGGSKNEGWRGQKWGLAKNFWNGHAILENAEKGRVEEGKCSSSFALELSIRAGPTRLCVGSLGLHTLPTGQGVNVDA